MNKTDPFHVLGLPPGASRDEVRRAYRKLAMRWHPDRNPHTHAAEERFKHIKAAYEIASDEAAYRHWCATRTSANAADSNPPAPASDDAPPIEQTLPLTLEEVAHGSRRTIRVARQVACAPCGGSGRIAQTHSQPCRLCLGIGRLRGRTSASGGTQKCPGCDGQGYVRYSECGLCAGQGRTVGEAVFEVVVPAGLRDGETLRLARTDSSVLLRIVYLPHPFFTVDRDDLHCVVPVDVLTMVAGGDIVVPTLDGNLCITLPGAPIGAEIRLKKKGLPHRKGRAVGDLLLQLRPVIPKHLSAAERAQLSALQASLAENAATRMPEIDDWRKRLARRK